MAVFYEELEGSPSVNMDRKGGSAHREVRINWDDINLFLAELFPDPWYGYLGDAVFPGYEWLTVQSVKATPFDPARPTGFSEIMNTYPSGWRVSVDYGVPPEDKGMQGGNVGGSPGSPAAPFHGGDHSGPGGSQGSTGDQQGQDQTFVSHKVTIGGEFITWPSNTIRWGYPKDGLQGTIADVLEKNFKVGHDTVVGNVMPTVEHHITWHFVPWPPWAAIRQCIGRLNAFTFAGAPPGTLLFLGVEASIDYTAAGAKAWSLGYKFSEKNNNPLNPLRPMGWNYFLRPDGINAGYYQPITRTIPARDLKHNQLDLVQNGTPRTSLVGGVGPAGVTLTVTDAGDFPPQEQFRIVIDPRSNLREECAVIGGQGTNTWTVLRGVNGTKQQAHLGGRPIYQYSGQVYDLSDYRFLFQPGVPL